MEDFIDELLDDAPVPNSAPKVVKKANGVPAKVVNPAPAKVVAPAKKTAAAPKATEVALDNNDAGMKAARAAAGKYTLSSIEEAVKKKGMWAGAILPVTIPDLQGCVPKHVATEDVGEDAEPITAGFEEGESDAEGSVASADSSGPTPKKKTVSSVYRPSVEMVDIEREHTPALLKAFDELIVNASDHAKEYCAANKTPPSQRVTRIEATFDMETGRFVLENDGPGIPVVLHEGASADKGRDVFVPEVAVAIPLAGTNIDKEDASVKGGTNGLGAKIANLHSVEFTIETVDPLSRQFYSQTFRDRLKTVEPPTIVDLRRAADIKAAGLAPEAAAPHTTISYLPAYAALGYKLASEPGQDIGSLRPDDAYDIDAWLRLRLHQTAAYVGTAVRVTYNGDVCETTSAAKLGRLLVSALGTEIDQSIILTGVAKATELPYKTHPWELAVIVLPPGVKAGRKSVDRNMTLVNGVVSNKGTHIEYIEKVLREVIDDKVRKLTGNRSRKPTAGKASDAVAEVLASKTGLASGGKRKAAAPKAPKPPAEVKLAKDVIFGGLWLVLTAPIPWAGRPDWQGQRKDELKMLAATGPKYAFTKTFLADVGKAVGERIVMAMTGKTAVVKNAKHTRARRAGTAKRAAHPDTYLMAAEGDSAIALLKAGLTQKKNQPPGGPSLEWCGYVSLQGVITNAAREVSELEMGDGSTVMVRSHKLRQNQRLLALADAFGLREDRSYETAEEQATLHYGKMVLCVDQDLDGTGKIAPLVLVWIHLFWPALIRDGKIGRFMTPLVRCYPKRAGAGLPVLEFHYETELDHWREEDPDRAEQYRVKYYKGLATHNKKESIAMFELERFRSSIYTYTLDDIAAAMFRVHFGPDSSLRKRELVTPVLRPTYEEAREMRRRRQIPVGRVQLGVDTKLYKNEAIKRQIAGGVDGLNPARRKILAGALLRFASEAKSKELKIFQLGGYVADKMFYHHGEASLNGTIIYLAQAFPGARRYPYLIGEGMFGSRHGDAAGSARYIAVKKSPLITAAFPPDDRWHLPYATEDGERAEPRYFVPVAPMAALESYRIVSEGWNHDSHGRALDAVLRVTRAYIGGDPGLVAAADALSAHGPTPATVEMIDALMAAWPLPAETRGYTGEVRTYRAEAYSFGAYLWDETTRTVTVTELPMGVMTAAYLTSLVKPGRGGKPNERGEFIETIADNSTSDRVELEIVLKPGAFERISEKYGDRTIDPIEDALLLRASLRPHLNYYSASGGVLEFGECYLAAILYWAPVRRAMYVARVTRDLLVARLRILEEENVLRYVPLAAELDLASLDDDAAAAQVLAERGFVKLHVGLLHRPEYAPNDTFEAAVLRGAKASYDYLLDLPERELVRSAVARRQKRLDALRADLTRAESLLAERPVPCATLWLQELDRFLDVVEKGVATGWTFEKDGDNPAADPDADLEADE